jgi:hypothetical protein
VFPVRAVTRYADFGILLISQRENLLDPFNTVLWKYTKWLKELCPEEVLIIGEGSFPPPPTTFYGKLKDKTRAIMVDLHIPNTTKVPGFLAVHIRTLICRITRSSYVRT